MDAQLYPSLIIATAAVRPAADEEDEADPKVLGDAYAAVGVTITVPTPKAKVQVTLKENSVMNKSTWTGVLEEAGTEYYVGPKISYKFDQLRKMDQQVPLDVTFSVMVDGKDMGEQSETITTRSINDCPYLVIDGEATIDDEEQKEEGESPYTKLEWMFAAYVNENSPVVDQILKEALATGIVNDFSGYQGDGTDVLRQALAIWTALQGRGIKYSSITATAGASEVVLSQHVRFIDQSIGNEQANCVDGSVLFASILRKIGLRTFLVSVPGHMFMGFYLKPEGDARVALETTQIGAELGDEEETEMEALETVKESLDEETAESDGWKSFASAIATGTNKLEENWEKIEAEDDVQYQLTDVDESRKEGIMPISYQKSE